MASCMIHLYAGWLYAQKIRNFWIIRTFIWAVFYLIALIWVDLRKKKFVGIPI